MAIEAADVALFTNDLRCLAALMALAHVARRKVLQNVAFSVVTKVCTLCRKGWNSETSSDEAARRWRAAMVY